LSDADCESAGGFGLDRAAVATIGDVKSTYTALVSGIEPRAKQAQSCAAGFRR